MKKIRELDFSFMPAIESMDMFIRLEKDVEDSLKGGGPLIETYERSAAALMFLCGTSEEKEGWRWRI